jgi:hypothetical protein
MVVSPPSSPFPHEISCFHEPEVVPTGARVLQVSEKTLTPDVAFSPGDSIEVSIQLTATSF